jgi:hypothetical protein
MPADEQDLSDCIIVWGRRQIILNHCDGTYIETNRVELRGYTTVDAECIDGSESLQ